MPEIAPFRAVVYNVPLDGVVCPPYDKIDDAQRAELLEHSEHNAVRIVLPRDEDPDPDGGSRDRYRKARAVWERWLHDGILGKRPQPAMYVLRQTFETLGRPGTRERRGLLALLRIDPDDNPKVLAHEQSFDGPRRDRERLGEALAGDFDQIMLLVEDEDGGIRTILHEAVAAGPAFRKAKVAAHGRDRAEIHALHEVTDEGEIAGLREALRGKDLMIADGHHRFAAAVALAKASGQSIWRQVVIFSASDPDCVILPTHRLVSPAEPMRARVASIAEALDGLARIEEPATALGRRVGPGEAASPALGEDPLADAVAEELAALPDDVPGAAVIVVRAPGANAPVLRRVIPEPNAATGPDDEPLAEPLRSHDVAVAQRLVLERALGVEPEAIAISVDFHRHIPDALAALRRGEGSVVLFLRPTRVDQVIAVCKAGARMPQKSTDFYPKLLSGLCGYDHRDAPDASGGTPPTTMSDDSAPAASRPVKPDGDKRTTSRSGRMKARILGATRPRLFIPGPTNVDEAVRKAMTAPMIGHRSDDYRELHSEIKPLLRDLFMTEGRVLVMTASATAGMEAAIRSCVGGRVLALVNGAFSERWREIAIACGKEVDALEVPWGKAIRAVDVAAALEAKGPYDAITVVHSETSTGVLNPLFEIAQLLRNHKDTMLMVDTVSSMGTVAIPVDRLRIDVCVTGSQKALALPPGLCFVSVSERALERAKSVTGRGRYLDLIDAAKYDDKDMTPSTPAISLLYGLRVALERIFEEGLDARFQRHLVMAARCRAWAKERFALYPEEPHVAYGLTTVTNTRKLDIGALNSYLSTDHGVVISNGYGKLKDETFRIGHMGDTTLEELDGLLDLIDAYVGF